MTPLCPGKQAVRNHSLPGVPWAACSGLGLVYLSGVAVAACCSRSSIHLETSTFPLGESDWQVMTVRLSEDEHEA